MNGGRQSTGLQHSAIVGIEKGVICLVGLLGRDHDWRLVILLTFALAGLLAGSQQVFGPRFREGGYYLRLQSKTSRGAEGCVMIRLFFLEGSLGAAECVSRCRSPRLRDGVQLHLRRMRPCQRDIIILRSHKSIQVCTHLLGKALWSFRLQSSEHSLRNEAPPPIVRHVRPPCRVHIRGVQHWN